MEIKKTKISTELCKRHRDKQIRNIVFIAEFNQSNDSLVFENLYNFLNKEKIINNQTKF